MYEGMTYEVIMNRLLKNVEDNNSNLDTREGSVVYNALAPAAIEIAQMYIELDYILDQVFADTASREYLIKRCAERGIYPREATKAIRKGEFNINVPIGSRFSLSELNYIVTDKISDCTYKLECETVGEVGNYEYGNLILIDYIDGLTSANLTDVLIPGEDEEDTESLRKRYYNSIETQAFGGNVADYKEKVIAIDGVGGVKVHRAWNGGIRPAELIPPDTFAAWLTATVEMPDGIRTWLNLIFEAATEGVLTTGGAVRLIIIDSAYNKPSDTLLDMVQTEIDPVENHGEGLGIAPIGHVVTVRGVEEAVIDIKTHITYKTGWNWESVKPYVENCIDDYFKEISKGWADSESIIIRISQIETRLLGVMGILDIADTLINGATMNLILSGSAIPVRGNISDG